MSNWLRDTATDINSRRSLSGRAHARRWRHVIEVFPSFAEMRVLDLGGTPESWRLAPVRPTAVTTVNLPPIESQITGITAIQGDACELPSTIANDHFDLVFSNSLLEHVGGHVRRQRLADNVHRLADRHWVQTPYRYFPIEPHWLFPGIQWLPYEARVQISMRWNRGYIRTHTREEAQEQVDEIDLIGIAQMRRYFPSSLILYERFAGLIKSLVAIKTDHDG
ncbi:class I SAM-dependent methyltransferase [Mycobacterium ulcerans]|uniref:Class I SAM-dependent methyltransferase n=2 Tax=Mycobacterium ulcerans TaxID=1809 RepID=A0ABY3VDC8_MYCUL|nr:class I SAM-dependent methyltransferase [Mycobacterium ulcerans]EUA85975.1 putative methyltransferase type 11 [Mycobacterium ulcerans str. Harvey]MEB3967859.1 class I SAM-dependent methyltransferase [Mycobacterium ulcerans]MEB3976110.1 class I SAM-dependent methyltransferase [Mycobacterium ulcerans]MEB4005382.1 class I SAM-dependent methyltransferase [Mycobacterium ulcerans]MEB4414954.1 class I SAM-dependent methyltransferase [Mycobacterium ulcerans]